LCSVFLICHMSVPTKSKIRIFLIYWFPLIMYCLAIYIQSGFPGFKHIPEVRFFDKVLHFGAYGLLGILFYRAYETLPLSENKNLLILLSIGSATLYGISDEIHQYFVPFRYADILDGMANTIGSIFGVYFYDRWKAVKKPT